MTKRKKITVISIVLILFLLIFGNWLFGRTVMTFAARCYLADKYDDSITSFHLVDFDEKHLYPVSYGLPEFEVTPYKWEFKYNEKNFFVNLDKGNFYDDYQLEDIDKWCVEWLQKNIDNRIYGVLFPPRKLMIEFQNNNGTRPIKESEVYDSLILFYRNSSETQDSVLWFDVYYYDESLTKKEEIEQSNQMIENKMKEFFDERIPINVEFSEGKIITVCNKKPAYWEIGGYFEEKD